MKRPCTEEAQTLRPVKKLRSEPVAVVQAPKKPEVYLRVKRNYSFWVRMVGLIDTLVSEMVKQREAEERTAAALERLMKWVEETESELDREELEKSWRSRGLEKGSSKKKMNIVFRNKTNDFFFWIIVFF